MLIPTFITKNNIEKNVTDCWNSFTYSVKVSYFKFVIGVWNEVFYDNMFVRKS